MANVVTIAEARDYLNITSIADDDNIQSILDAAENWVSKYTGCKFCDGTSTEAITERLTAIGRCIQTTYHPVESVDSIVDYSTDYTVPTTYYTAQSKAIWMNPRYGSFNEDKYRYTVTYNAGYTSTTVPDAIKLAILLLTSRYYNSRHDATTYNGTVSVTFPNLMDSTVVEILEPYRFRTDRNL